MQRWEYLYVRVRQPTLHGAHAAFMVNGQELKDWEKTPLHVFLAQIGTDGWEMIGTLSEDGYTVSMIFKRPRP